MTNHCLVCKKSSFNVIYHNTLKKCIHCGFVTANLEIDDAILKKIYSDNYFKGEEYLNYLNDKEAITNNFNRRLNYIQKLYPSRQMGNVLEIGCAYGFFGEELQRHYPGASYSGFDVAEEACAHASEVLKLNVQCADFLSADINSSFSDIFMWDVIEHLSNPDKFIEKISQHINKGGKLYITTGDIGALLPKLQRAKWRMIHPPSHLHYFTKKSLIQLLENYGFKVTKITYPGTSRSIKQIFYSLFLLKKKGNSLTRFIYNKIPKNSKITINTFDIMFIIAKKTY